jgi:hypothetical protein
MNKLLLLALISTSLLAVGGPGREMPPPDSGMREPARAAGTNSRPSSTWTCVSNRYRSVKCT